MLSFNHDTNAITMIAKDTGDFVVTLDNYILDEGDIVHFTVNDELEKEIPLIHKAISTFTDHQALISLSSADTDLTPGTYYYDIQVNAADGRVDTVIGPAKFKVLGGVRY